MAGLAFGIVRRSAARILLGGCVALSAACGAESTTADAPSLPTSLRIEGYVDLGATQATDVRVTGRCGQHELTAVTDGDGRYSLDLDELECDRITIEHVKTGFLPVYRVVPVPPSESPFSIEVELAPMEELECGIEMCHTEGDTDVQTGGVIARGYHAGQSGDRALDGIPPDMRTPDGELISFLGFQYFELYDKDGELLEDADLVEGCTRIRDDGLSWVGDVDKSTAAVELDWYYYDAQHGEWGPSAERGTLMYRRGNKFTRDERGRCVDVKDYRGVAIRELLPVERESMPDVRAEEFFVADPCSIIDQPDPLHINEYWVCGPVHGGGFYAYGRSTPDQSCYALHVTDGCGEPVAGAEFSARGVEHGYLHHAFTGPAGTACIDVMASEPTGEDFDLDELGGETFAVDLRVDGNRAGSTRIDARENATSFGSCADPDTCIQLDEQLRRCVR